MNETETETVTSGTMCALGASYRQVDYWSKRGYLRPELVHTGSGVHRQWPWQEYDILRIMVKLQAAGVEVARSAQLAREAVTSGEKRVDLGGGVVISFEDPDTEDPEPDSDPAEASV